MDAITIITRIALAGFLSGIVGWEREAHGRSAGFRTNILVGMAGALFMILSLEMFRAFPELSSGSILRIDPGRIASYAVAGIGFMGAGVILKGRGEILGITTAACLWMDTAIGLTVGFGLYIPAVAVTVFTLITLRAMVLISRRWIHQDLYTRVVVQVESSDLSGQLRVIENTLQTFPSKVLFVGYNQDIQENTIQFQISLRSKRDDAWRPVADRLSQLPGVTRVEWHEGQVP